MGEVIADKEDAEGSEGSGNPDAATVVDAASDHTGDRQDGKPEATPDSAEQPRNLLRDPRDRRLPRTPEPCALVVFGVTGDLARKKLLPAIYDLGNRGLLPPDFVLLGFARRD